MKEIFLILIFIGSCSIVNANHTKGGWMYYEYLGQGSSANTSRYRITLKVYTECELNPGQTDNVVPFTFFDAENSNQVFNINVNIFNDLLISNCNSPECHPCINFPPAICYRIRTYQLEMELPNTPSGYIVAHQRCCRVRSIENIQAPSQEYGETWTVKIPGTLIAPGAETNSSAKFSQNDTAIICQNDFFTFDFSATDINNDSLVYSFVSAYSGGANGSPRPDPASNPPFNIMPYASGYSGAQPLGSNVTIDRRTGIVSGIAPTVGIYVVTALVSEYIRGTNIKKAEVRKSLHIQVADCASTRALLNPEYISCDGFTVNFKNNASGGNIQTYDWEFGDGITSTSPEPSHTYADTGVYILKLVVNRGGSCSDSANATVRVFPGYFPAFTQTSPICKGVPVQFSDNTRANYGFANTWIWDFGNLNSISDTSNIKNPLYTYPIAGTYNARLIVASNKGCVDTIFREVTILNKPPFSLSNDTLICSIDTLRLVATASAGNITWSPNYMISNINSFTPLVSPDVTTTYKVQYADNFGCSTTDSVTVNVVDRVTLQGIPNTTICRTDAIVLSVNSNALQFIWTPPATLNNTSIQNPVATPTAPVTTYRVIGRIGKCVDGDDIVITTVPYPLANAGRDSTICFGNSIQLQASGGSMYAWSPGIFLNNANIANPVLQNPTEDIRYIVTVRDTLGCPKPISDTVFIQVATIVANAEPAVTNIVLGQPLQLTATGSTNYLWSPSTWLTNSTIFNPVAMPQENINYVVKVSNAQGCFDLDTIKVNVFKIDPDLLVPTAFSPNGDRVNDIFKPIVIGMRSLEAFKVYNRWGQLVYSTTQTETGWDGTFGGAPQGTATFVWYAEGINYLGKKIKKKGTVVLIR